jgi:hypothetical protein
VRAIRLQPGLHELRAVRPGYEESVVPLALNPGTSRIVELKLARHTPWLKRYSASFGVGMTTVGVFAAWGGVAAASLSQSDALGCVTCPESKRPLFGQVRALSISADILLGVGAALAVTTIALAIREARHSRSSPARASSMLSSMSIRF